MTEKYTFFDLILDLLGISARIQRRLNVKDAWGISKNFYVTIGLVAAEWARLEELMGVLSFLLLGVEPHVGMTLTANLGFRSRLQVIQSIIEMAKRPEQRQEITDPDHHAALMSVIDDLGHAIALVEDAYPKRNMYIHNFYSSGGDVDDANMLSVRVKGKLKVERRIVSFSEVFAAYDQIAEARNRIAKVVRKLDHEGFFHDIDQQASSRPTEGTPSRDPTPKAPPQPSAQGSEAQPRPRHQKLSSAQKRVNREKDEASQPP